MLNPDIGKIVKEGRPNVTGPFAGLSASVRCVIYSCLDFVSCVKQDPFAPRALVGPV